MSEREVFLESIPQIAEMILECKKLSKEEYQEFKCEVMRRINPLAQDFIGKMFTVIDGYL